MLDSNVPRPWAGRTTLVFSLAAVAVGLGNLFRMPWLIGEHGGGPFFLAYVLSLLLLTTPVLIAEVMLGAFGRGSPLGSLRWAADQSGRAPQWQWLGVAQALLALLLAVELALVTVWMIDRAFVLQVGDLAAASPNDFADSFVALAQLDLLEFWGLAALLLLAGVLAAAGPGIAMGVIGWLLLPGIVVTLFALVDYSLSFGALREAEEFLFRRDTDRFDMNSALAALMSAAITLGAGLSVGLCFGGRAPAQLPLARSVLASAVLDTLFMLAVVIVVVPLLYAVNMEPTEGAALVFVALPYAFGNLPLGEAYGALFFGAAAAAGFAALVALLEPAIMVLRSELEWPRWLAAIVVVGLVWMLAITPGATQDRSLYTLDGMIAVLLPVSLLLTAVFVGWRMPRALVRGELYLVPRWLFMTWWTLLRWVVPLLAAVLVVWQWQAG